jgi:hypothetical protein
MLQETPALRRGALSLTKEGVKNSVSLCAGSFHNSLPLSGVCCSTKPLTISSRGQWQRRRGLDVRAFACGIRFVGGAKVSACQEIN